MKQLINLRTAFNRIWMTGVLMFLVIYSSNAQRLTVKGTVTGADDNETIPGVTVLVKGTTNGTITDIDGKYTMKAKEGDILQFSFIGMESLEMPVIGELLNVEMKIDVEELDEVIVIGYGTQKKKELTGSVARVDSEDINKFLSSDLGASIQGRIAGVNVVAGSGEPGAGSNILIRGISSISGSTEPLYVVDGVPQDSDPRIPNTEIESIDVLKDAASAAIYGTRGANGVVLITTKSGKVGDPKVSLEASWGFNRINSDLELLNTEQTLYWESQRRKFVPEASAGVPEISRRPEWLQNNTELSSLVQNDGAMTQNYNMNVSGGQKSFSYSATLGYFDQEGIMVNSGLERINGRLTTRYDKNGTTIRTSLGYTQENNDIIDGSLLFWAISYLPYYPEVDINTDQVDVLGGASETRANNLLTRLKRVNNRKRDRFNGSVDVSHEIIKGLQLRTVLGGAINNTLDEDFAPSYTIFNVSDGTSEPSDPTRSFSQMQTTRQSTWTVNPSISYSKKLGGHKLTGLVAFSLDERNQEVFTARAEGIDDPNLSVLNNGLLAEFATNGFNYTIRQASWIGRVQYNYKGRYLFSASMRRDASSKFAAENRWANFPSVSAGWVVSDEPFMDNISVANFIKLRGSYGTNGNESFSAYSYSAFIRENYDYIWSGSDVTVGKAQAEFANGNVQWETKTQTNLGLDLGLFDNKLTASVDYYHSDNKDMLFPIQLSPSSGVPFLNSYGLDESVVLNVGNMTNNGIEIAANYRMIKGDFDINLGGTFTRNRNEIKKIFGDTEGFFNSAGQSVIGDPNSVVSKMQVGYEAAAYFLYETNGVVSTQEELEEYQKLVGNARLGDLMYVDANGDSTINTDDQVYKGSALPDYELGFNLDVAYKGFDFSMLWYASVGNEVINGSAIAAFGEGRHKDLVNMWTPDNVDSNVPIWVDNHKRHDNYRGTTDRWVEDGSFLRLKLVTLGYTLPQNLVRTASIDRVRFYVSAQNPLTFTEYTGYDPEIGGNNIVQKGLDKGRYPVSAQYLMGVQMSF